MQNRDRMVPEREFCLDSKRDHDQAGRVPETTTCVAVITCFNEVRTIAPLVAAVSRYLSSVIVVDDGSTDGSSSLASGAGAEVVAHRRNLGKGTALKTGLSRARQRGFEWALVLDGDGQHVPGDLPAFWRCAEQTGALLVVGNRMHNAQAIPWLRRQVNCWMSRQLSRRAGRCLPDTQCGFRLVHLETWATLPLHTERFEIESEMLMVFLAAGHRVEFVPIRVIGRGYRSHIRPVADSLRWWKWWRQLKRPAGACAPDDSEVRVPRPAVAHAQGSP
ncbi:MAG: glycosyltransferase family 2 protein [Limisphaerales bacterium]